MQLKAITALALCSTSTTAAVPAEARATKSCFPKDVQAGVLNLQNYINIVINDIVQGNTDHVANDYSSTGRDIAFLVYGIRPKGCPTVPFPSPASTQNAAIADLQKTQLTLSYVAQDAINGQCQKGKKDVCSALYLYENVAQYVDSIRTDGP